MIRINLAPTKKKRAARAARTSAPSATAGQLWVAGMLLGWIVLGSVGYWLVSLETDAADKLRRDAAAKNKEADQIKKDTDEAGLVARKEQVEQMEVAIKKLTAKRRTPVYVMYELAMILTDSRDGGGPDIDQEKYRQNLKADPQSAINDRWDPTGLWISEIQNNGGALSITGEARDAADLTEFTRRLRASARFGSLSNSDWQREGNPEREDEARDLTWKLNVNVRRWD